MKLLSPSSKRIFKIDLMKLLNESILNASNSNTNMNFQEINYLPNNTNNIQQPAFPNPSTTIPQYWSPI